MKFYIVKAKILQSKMKNVQDSIFTRREVTPKNMLSFLRFFVDYKMGVLRKTFVTLRGLNVFI